MRDSVAIRQRIGYLPSELKLWENWTGVEYIRWLEPMRGMRGGSLDEAPGWPNGWITISSAR